jgi:hypothetical protein
MLSAGLCMNSAIAVIGPPETILIGVVGYFAKIVRYIVTADSQAALDTGVDAL